MYMEYSACKYVYGDRVYICLWSTGSCLWSTIFSLCSSITSIEYQVVYMEYHAGYSMKNKVLSMQYQFTYMKHLGARLYMCCYLICLTTGCRYYSWSIQYLCNIRVPLSQYRRVLGTLYLGSEFIYEVLGLF